MALAAGACTVLPSQASGPDDINGGLAAGECRVTGNLSFQPAAGPVVSTVQATLLVSGFPGSCAGSLPAGNWPTINFNGPVHASCAGFAGTGDTSVAWNPDTLQQGATNQLSAITGTGAAGTVDLTLVPSVTFSANAEFAITSTGAAAECAGGNLDTLALTGVVEFAST
jgi:hypothetical protein